MFIAVAKSKKFLCRRSGGKILFFLNFLYTFETHDCFNFFAKVHGLEDSFDDTAFSFSIFKSLFLHLVLLNVCKT